LLTPEDLLTIVTQINSAFEDAAIDTVSFSTKTVFTGTRLLEEVPFLHPTPGIAPVIFSSTRLVRRAEPIEFRLDQNYPNPFNPTKTLSFVIDRPSMVPLK